MVRTTKQSIQRKRATVVTHLRQALGSDFIVVGTPDHPLVMRSVDVLIGGRAGLTAIMMKTVEEVRRPSLFSARLLLNKAALPPHTNFVYLEAVGDDDQVGEANAFAVELEYEDALKGSDLIGIAAEPQRHRRLSASDKLQQQAEARFGNTYRLARVLQRGVPREAVPRAKQSSRRPIRDKLPNDIEAAFFDMTPSVPAIATLALEGAERWFALDDGEPLPVDRAAGAVFADSYPVSRGDPDKVLRAAAFAGWVLAPRHGKRSQSEVAELIARYARLL